MIASATQFEQPRSELHRWECRCRYPPVLLALYEPGGSIEIKAGRHWYYIDGGNVQAICPVCGEKHCLKLS